MAEHPWFGERNAEEESDDAKTLRLSQDQISQSARDDAMTPIYRPEPPAPPPARQAPRVNFALPPVGGGPPGGGPFAWPGPALTEPVAPAPFGKADRRDQPFLFPPPDAYGVTPDFRDPGMLTGVPPGGSVAAAAAPGRYGVIQPQGPSLAEAATTENPVETVPRTITGQGLGKAGPADNAKAPTLESLATKGMLALGPKEWFDQIAAIKEAATKRDPTYADRKRELDLRLKLREDIETRAYASQKAAREAYNEAYPEAPKLKDLPEAPDVKIRPWLDPEGKNAIVVMVQALSALALSAGGVALGAPQTMLKHLRESAEAWRRDEVDKAASNFKQFEMATLKVKHDNELALQRLAYQEKRWGLNVEAKKAGALADITELGLHDQAMTLAMLPYDDALKQIESQIHTATTILKAYNDYGETQAKLAAVKDGMQLTRDKLPGTIAGLNDALRDPNLDPDKKADLERKLRYALDAKKEFADMDQEKQAANVLQTQDAATLKQVEDKISNLHMYRNDVAKAIDGYVEAERQRILPKDESYWSAFGEAAKRKLGMGEYTPEQLQLLGRLQEFFPKIGTGESVQFFRNLGLPQVEDFAKFKDKILPYDLAMGKLRSMKETLDYQLAEAERRQKELVDRLKANR